MKDINSIVNYCRGLLKEYPGAHEHVDYLNNRLNKESQEKFEFGFFPNSENLELLLSVFDKQHLKDLSLIYPKEISDSLCHRNIWISYFEHHPLIMPYKDLYGNVIAIVGRTLLNDHDRKKISISKYKNTIFKKGNHLFGLFESKESILKQDLVYVVEGQFDVIKSFEMGLTNVVALGSANMSTYQFSLLLRYTKNMFLVLDNDEAGIKGRKNIIDRFGKYANIKNLYVHDPYKDMDEYFNSTSEISFLTKY